MHEFYKTAIMAIILTCYYVQFCICIRISVFLTTQGGNCELGPLLLVQGLVHLQRDRPSDSKSHSFRYNQINDQINERSVMRTRVTSQKNAKGTSLRKRDMAIKGNQLGGGDNEN